MDVKIYRNRRSKNGHVGGFILEVKKHILIVIFYFTAISGLFLGSYIVKELPEIFSVVKSTFENFCSSVEDQTLLKNFTLQLVVNVGLLLTNFIFGLCAIGFPIPFLTVFMKGIGIGTLSSFLYAEHRLSGFGFCMLVFYPVQLIITLVLIFFGKESTKMSVQLLKSVTEQNIKQNERHEIKKYAMQFILCLLIVMIVSFISAVLNVYVVKLFDF